MPPEGLAEGAGAGPAETRDRIERRRALDVEVRLTGAAAGCANVRRWCGQAEEGKAERGDGSRASAGAGWRTDEEEGTPEADGGSFLGLGRGRAEGDKNDEGGSYSNGNNGVENDAQGAMIGVGFKGVGMRYLDDSQKSKQNEAEDGGRYPGTGRVDNRSASSLLEIVQEYLHVKDTQIWTQRAVVWLRRALRKNREQGLGTRYKGLRD